VIPDIQNCEVKHAKSGHGGPVHIKCKSINDHQIRPNASSSSSSPSSSSNYRASSQQNTKKIAITFTQYY